MRTALLTLSIFALVAVPLSSNAQRLKQKPRAVKVRRAARVLKIYPRLELVALLRVASMTRPHASPKDRRAKLFTNQFYKVALDAADAKIRAIEAKLRAAGKTAQAKRLAGEGRKLLKIRQLVDRGAHAQANRQLLALRGSVLLVLAGGKADALGRLADARALRAVTSRFGLRGLVGETGLRALSRVAPAGFIEPQFAIKLVGEEGLIGEDGLIAVREVSALANRVAASTAKLKASAQVAAKIRGAKLAGDAAKLRTSLDQLATASGEATTALAGIVAPTELGALEGIVTPSHTRGVITPTDLGAIPPPSP